MTFNLDSINRRRAESRIGTFSRDVSRRRRYRVFQTLNHNSRMVLGLPRISKEKKLDDDDYITKRRLVIFCLTLIYSIQTAAVAVRFVGLLVISMD